MARATDKNEDAKRYSDLYADIGTAFQKAYIKDHGTVGNGSQTSYVLTPDETLAKVTGRCSRR